MSDLKAYFESRKGWGVLATADAEGRVNTAVYATPHVMDAGSVAFIMLGRKTHDNLLQNPHASYLYHEEGPGFSGKRFWLKKVREEEDTELLHALRRRKSPHGEDEEKKPRFLVFFSVEKELPLIGAGEA